VNVSVTMSADALEEIDASIAQAAITDLIFIFSP
jgi:hypothetical protein